jgi:uncharacterized protein (DUF924 family)
MTDKAGSRTAAQAEREKRQAAALRENLKRRKQQARGRADAGVAVSAELAEIGAAIRDFWFGAPGDPERGRMRKKWFEKSDAFDAELRTRFLAAHERAASGGCDALATTPDGVLALMILLDQLPRNLFRGTARAFATDRHARDIAAGAVAVGLDMQLAPVERVFVYLPFEHSEDLADQRRSVALFESLPATPDFPEAERANVVDFARRHLVIIERFGRFPHRNAAFGRASTPEEIAFLTQPNSSF